LQIHVRMRALFLGAIAVFALANASSALAETLAQAMSSAYHNNSTLESERAALRATDENVPQALSGWRPTITANESVTHTWTDTSVPFATKGEGTRGDLSITLSQPIFRGFKTVESTAVAEAQVNAGRQNLLVVEQATLFNAIQAYMNVVQFRQILGLRQKNVGVLQKQLNATEARFKAGELTRTDVSQARATLSGSQGQLAVAIANVKAAEANFLQVIGHNVGKLAMPGLAPRPRSLNEAQSIAQQTNPNILFAAQVQDASEHQIGVIGGDLLPQLSVLASASVDRNFNNDQYTTVGTIQGSLVVPIYEAGRTYSGVRQAKETASQNRLKVVSAVRSVRESVTNAWNNIVSSGQGLQSARSQVAASRLALDGVQQEYQVGSRSTIDVLNAEQTLVNSEIAQVTAQHDQVVASYQLLATMGHLTARHLGIGGLYDPREHYKDVRNKWIGLDAEVGEPH
jgi:outer membrane protein